LTVGHLVDTALDCPGTEFVASVAGKVQRRWTSYSATMEQWLISWRVPLASCQSFLRVTYLKRSTLLCQVSLSWLVAS